MENGFSVEVMPKAKPEGGDIAPEE